MNTPFEVAQMALTACGIKSEIKGNELHFACSQKKLMDNAHALVGSGVSIYKTGRGKFVAVAI